MSLRLLIFCSVTLYPRKVILLTKGSSRFQWKAVDKFLY